jgi:hypothetical protein
MITIIERLKSNPLHWAIVETINTILWILLFVYAGPIKTFMIALVIITFNLVDKLWD